MTHQDRINEMNAEVYEGEIKLNLLDARLLLDSMRAARDAYPSSFEVFNEVFLKISAIETELWQRLDSKYARQKVEQELAQENAA
ncbi:hypothetical protein [Pseudomonas oryzihabitans]|uniref:hypothetical protein n=1 Tax=Pseudomonas oryzihabitans TaxID=47885 RepID=UPI003639473C